MLYNEHCINKLVSVYAYEGGNNMDNGFMAYIQAFIEFILKIISFFKSNDNTDSGNNAK